MTYYHSKFGENKIVFISRTHARTLAQTHTHTHTHTHTENSNTREKDKLMKIINIKLIKSEVKDKNIESDSKEKNKENTV